MTKDDADWALGSGKLFVTFRPTFPGVALPENLMSEPVVTLSFSQLYGTDIDLTDDYIAQELSFQGRNFLCHVPMAAVDHWYVGSHEIQPKPLPRRLRLLKGGKDD